MSRRLVLLTVALLVVVLAAPAAFAKSKDKADKNLVYVYAKNPLTWQIIEGGASGKMKYRPWGNKLKIRFKAQGLQPGVAYTLIYFPDPWPGHGLICLGEGVAADDGTLEMKEHFRAISELPIESDANYPCGAKIWLVLTTDVDCVNQVMLHWNPQNYLFQGELMKFEQVTPIESEGP
jgi:hypothetical protein